MLRKITNVAQHSEQYERLWYSGLELDLFVWLNEYGQMARFQLSYDKDTLEKSLVWDEHTGFAHALVDDGVKPGKHPASPILESDIPVNANVIIELLDAQKGDVSESLFLKLRELISSLG